VGAKGLTSLLNMRKWLDSRRVSKALSGTRPWKSCTSTISWHTAPSITAGNARNVLVSSSSAPVCFKWILRVSVFQFFKLLGTNVQLYHNFLYNNLCYPEKGPLNIKHGGTQFRNILNLPKVVKVWIYCILSRNFLILQTFSEKIK